MEFSFLLMDIKVCFLLRELRLMRLSPCHVYFILINLPLIASATSYNYTGGGQCSNSCPVLQCTTCPVGFYKAGCSGIEAGSCIACSDSSLPTNAAWITDGGFSDSCSFNCKAGFCLLGSLCMTNTGNIYTVSLSISLPL